MLDHRWKAALALAVVALVGFGAFAVKLWLDVTAARESLSHDVRWLVAVQALDEAIESGGDVGGGLEAVRAFSRTNEPSPGALSALATLEQALAQNDRSRAHAAAGELTRALRRQTASISASLADAWSRLGVLVGGALALALLAFAALVAVARTSARLVQQRAVEHEAALRETSRLSESLQSLAAQVTHDLANPLAFVMSNHQFLERQLAEKAGADGEVREALQDTGEGLRRIEGLMQGLRASSALMQSKQPARIADVLDAVLLLVEPRLKRNVQLVRDYQPLAGRLVDPLPFMRLVSLVLIDAAERCAPGQKGIVTLCADGDRLRVSIDGELTRAWTSSLPQVASGLTFEVSLEAPSRAAISLGPPPAARA
ncbi:MAG: histidine kinase dimerization/phospho-acceptor domain-containing protein [Myxococcaceae bacterium]|nr:histidine kinase dimerization/phospho-acceptor domain-containing protein [Myxococcaceae bacterium]